MRWLSFHMKQINKNPNKKPKLFGRPNTTWHNHNTVQNSVNCIQQVPPRFRHRGPVRLATVHWEAAYRLSAADVLFSATRVQIVCGSGARRLDAVQSPSCSASPRYSSPAVTASPETIHSEKQRQCLTIRSVELPYALSKPTPTPNVFSLPPERGFSGVWVVNKTWRQFQADGLAMVKARELYECTCWISAVDFAQQNRYVSGCTVGLSDRRGTEVHDHSDIGQRWPPA